MTPGYTEKKIVRFVSAKGMDEFETVFTGKTFTSRDANDKLLEQTTQVIELGVFK